ncbi:MAG: flagellar basal body L-ring protein FlgH [Halanaerobiales bacterium]|nr:flagellar basal body L-ring protein FlgH [Halanaerobiales bacterium]
MLNKNNLVLVLILLMIFTVTAGAESLWSEQSSGLYKDFPDYSQGDVITVLIEENANAVQSANTDTSQDSSYSSDGGGLLNFIPFIDFNYSDSESADGATQRSGTLEADITTRIAEVYDNGTFKIAGNKKVKINGEIQNISLEGIVRAEDIDFNNEISSKKVADANIEYEGDGTVGDKQKPGLLTRFFNYIF